LLAEYTIFEDFGPNKGVRPPNGYNRIRFHLKIDVKHDGHQKFRCGADEHSTNLSVQSVYSGVVFLKGLFI